MTKLERCRAGIDNAGGCNIHIDGFHTHLDALKCPNMRYDYDRCRREATHEVKPELPYHEAHLLDCGGAFYDDGDVDFTSWIEIYDLVKSSGEQLEWEPAGRSGYRPKHSREEA